MKNVISKFSLSFLLFAALTMFSCEKESLIPNDSGDDDFTDVTDVTDNTPDQVVKAMIPVGDYQSVFNEQASKGYRPVWIDGFNHHSGVATAGTTKTYFNVIFEKAPASLKWATFHGMTGNSYQEKFNNYVGNGYRLEFVESYVQNGAARYAAIFVKKSGPAWLAIHGKKHSEFQAFFNDKVDNGYRLVNRSIIKVGGQKYVTALFDKKNVGSWLSKSGLDTPSMQDIMEENHANGRPLAYLDVSQNTTSNYTFGPIFNSEPFNKWYAPNKMTLDELMDEIADAKAAGYKTTIVVGYDEYTPVNGNEVYTAKFAAAFKK